MENIIVDFVVVWLKSNSENSRRPLTFHRRIFSMFPNVMDFKMALCPKSARKSVWRWKSPTLCLIVCAMPVLGKLETLLNFTISSTRACRKRTRLGFWRFKHASVFWQLPFRRQIEVLKQEKDIRHQEKTQHQKHRRNLVTNNVTWNTLEEIQEITPGETTRLLQLHY